MQHTYLRYECADAFSLTTSSSTTSQPTTSPLSFFNVREGFKGSKHPSLLSTSGSQILGLNLRTCEICLKIGHRETLSGGLGTGRALNSNEVLCIINTMSPNKKDVKIASGWKDGSIRVFDIFRSDLRNQGQGKLVHSLLFEDNQDEFVMREPLLLNGHANSPITCLAFDDKANGIANRLASGSTDGTLVIWDILAETGLFRLSGHTGPITDIFFTISSSDEYDMDTQKLHGLISSSLDGLIKVWDLVGQCTQTVVNHRGQVTCCAISPKINCDKSSDTKSSHRERLLTGCSDGKIRLYSINKSLRMLSSSEAPREKKENGNKGLEILNPNTDLKKTSGSTEDRDDSCTFMGELPLPPNASVLNEKITSIHFHPDGMFVGVTRSNSKELYLYVFRSESEALRKRTRRLRRRREKNRKDKKMKEKLERKKRKGIIDDAEEKYEDYKGLNELPSLLDSLDPEVIKASDEFEYVTTVRCTQKIKAFTFAPYGEEDGCVRIVAALASNALEIHLIRKSEIPDTENIGDNEKYTPSLVSSFNHYGHPGGIRSINCSSDDSLACTVSKSVANIWNVANRSCIRSLKLGSRIKIKDAPTSFYGLCSIFLPGNTHLVIGTRDGYLLIIDIGSGDTVFNEKAHDGAVWSLDLKSANFQNGDDVMSIITGSADSTVKFWNVECQDRDMEDVDILGHPMLVHARTLKTKDDVIAVRYSHSPDPTAQMIFVSTLDCQINVFMADTLKFFLSLYGHSLPALALDASDDDTILASGGADKTVKIWGLDFGDTHRTMYGHSDSITDLRFVKKTHNFFTASKDKTVRYWDGDRFEQILLLQGHMSEISCLAVGKSGAYVLSAGMDRQVRVWERTNDMVFLDEEKEREMAMMFEEVDNKDYLKGTAQIMHCHQVEDGKEEEGNDQPQSDVAVKKSVLSVSAGDRIMEAIERADQEIKDATSFKISQQGKGENAKKRTPNIMMLGMEPSDYILWVLRSVKISELEQSLLVLPLIHMERLIFYMISLLRKGKCVEICARASIFLVKTHQTQVIGNKSMATPLRELRRLLKSRLAESRDAIGYNLAAIRIISKITKDYKNRFRIPSEIEVTDIWAGLGLGTQ